MDNLPGRACNALVSGSSLIKNLVPDGDDCSPAQEMASYSSMPVRPVPLPNALSEAPNVVLPCHHLYCPLVALPVSGYQEYCGAPAGEGGVKAGTGMAHQMMGPNFTR
ncbi:hypothetical protein DSO57_1021247 [Entomophthora muscae]|uniref:Uncharacterized protein n=1 Tax=Entomophthora muscae TaxID=34485 RepID=A0ACC2UPB7_9FUNG|nr:hypothetical protein DSO57_1021247 [Entomophthora muscae]